MSTNPNLTPWFPADVKPFRNGEYEIKANDGTDAFRLFWDGECWRLSQGGFRALIQARSWRGLAEPPKRGAV